MNRFIASDGYSVKFSEKTWEKRTVIVSVQSGEEPLKDNEQPVRLVIPGAESGNWIRGVIRMEVTIK